MRPKAIILCVSIPLAIGLLYYSVRGIDWREIARTVVGANLAYLAATSALATGSLFLRAVRWRILLNAHGTVDRPTAFWATAAGYFGNNFLPARAGELVRTVMVSSQSKLDKAYVLATALAERAADAAAVMVIGALALLALPVPPGWLANAATPAAILGLTAASMLVVLPWLESPAKSLLDRVTLPLAFRRTLVSVIEQVLRGIRTFHDAGRLLKFVGLTVIIFSIDALGTVVGGAALGFSIPIVVAFLLIAALSLGSVLPSTPGYVGIYQFVTVAVLTPFGFSRTDAIAFILVAQAVSYVVIGFWGSLGLLSYRRSRLNVSESRRHGQRHRQDAGD